MVCWYAWEVCFLIDHILFLRIVRILPVSVSAFYLLLLLKTKCLVCLSVYLLVCLSICLPLFSWSSFLAVSLSILGNCLSVCTSVCQPVCTGVSAYPVYLPLLAHLAFMQMSLYNHDFSPIWNHDLGGVIICDICVQLCWWGYLWQKLHICRYIQVMFLIYAFKIFSWYKV